MTVDAHRNSPHPDIRPGAVIADKYRIVREIGRGGMGIVVSADHAQLGQPVALKIMLRRGDPRALERFQREARIVARLQSQHVCKVFDVGALPDGTPFMVMELLEGETLRELVRRRGCLETEAAVDVLLQAGEAIAEAHAMGVVHRDLKPENLFVARAVDGQPTVKVLDFGISKIFSSSGHTLTETGELLGSPRFMAPEQLQRHHSVDARTDVWAMGVVLYELLTGVAAFRAETMAELLVFILQDDPDPIDALRPDVPAKLAHAVGRCLEKDADRRFANVAELAIALGPFASARGLPYVDRICHILRAERDPPLQSSSAPPTVVDPKPPSTTAVSSPLAPTAATRVGTVPPASPSSGPPSEASPQSSSVSASTGDPPPPRSDATLLSSSTASRVGGPWPQRVLVTAIAAFMVALVVVAGPEIYAFVRSAPPTDPRDEIDLEKQPVVDAQAKEELVVVVTEASHQPRDLAEALAKRLGTKSISKDGYFVVRGAGVNVMIASTLETAERDLSAGTVTPARMIVYFTGVYGIGLPVKHALRRLARKGLSVSACVQSDDMIDDRELILLQREECRDSVEMAGFSVEAMKSIDLTLSEGRNLDELVTALRETR